MRNSIERLACPITGFLFLYLFIFLILCFPGVFLHLYFTEIRWASKTRCVEEGQVLVFEVGEGLQVNKSWSGSGNSWLGLCSYLWRVHMQLDLLVRVFQLIGDISMQDKSSEHHGSFPTHP